MEIKDLFDNVSEAVSKPVQQTADYGDSSFVLHAPLELCARYYLFPLVEDPFKNEAALQIGNIKTRYESFDSSSDSSSRMELHFNTDFGLWSSSLLFAGHATVLAALVKRLGETNESIEKVLSAMNAKIHENPQAQFSWAKSFEAISNVSNVELPVGRKTIPSWFISNVANIDNVECDGESIAKIVNTVEEKGLIEPLIKSWVNFEMDPFDLLHHVYPILLRIAALSMIIENDEHSKYGWSHCLTIPHSHWVLADNPDTQLKLFCSSVTYVASFRSVFSKCQISTSDFEPYFDENEESIFTSHHEQMVDIISRASILEDAHLVKYVYSCFDVAKRDPHYTKLYIAASLALLKQWEV